jgi:hypothetical protein
MNIGDIVIFKEKTYKIFWIYESGYCELQNENSTIKLVPITDILLHNNKFDNKNQEKAPLE